jgi:hypothetical protein
MGWIKVKEMRPIRNVVVETKIDYEDGTPTRVQNLKMHETGNLWWLPDDSMYVYFIPTHWRHLTPKSKHNG